MDRIFAIDIEGTRNSSGQIVMDTLPIDLAGILAELPDIDKASKLSEETFPNGARIGHIHLRVTNLERSVWFYSDVLGLHITADLSTFGAMFLSAGGYHHHIGLNTWHSLDGSKHSRKETGLDDFTIQFLNNGSYMRYLESRFERKPEAVLGKIEDGERICLSDPDGIQLRIREE